MDIIGLLEIFQLFPTFLRLQNKSCLQRSLVLFVLILYMNISVQSEPQSAWGGGGGRVGERGWDMSDTRGDTSFNALLNIGTQLLGNMSEKATTFTGTKYARTI